MYIEIFLVVVLLLLDLLELEDGIDVIVDIRVVEDEWFEEFGGIGELMMLDVLEELGVLDELVMLEDVVVWFVIDVIIIVVVIVGVYVVEKEDVRLGRVVVNVGRVVDGIVVEGIVVEGRVVEIL